MTMTDNPTRKGVDVDVATLFATLDAVKANPEIARFSLSATNTRLPGTPRTPSGRFSSSPRPGRPSSTC